MILRSNLLAQAAGVRHAFFTRDGGVSTGLYGSLNGGLGSGDAPEHVRENRARMANALGVPPDHFISAHQVHSAEAVAVETPWPMATRPKLDGIATATPGIALGVGAADCGPVLFADPQARVIGAAHAGWKGALTGILESTIAKMETLGARRGRIRAALGPMISQRHYEVGPEFVARFREADAASARFFVPSPREGHAMFDLPGYIRARLAAAGLTQIDDLALCTYADEARFFSYRRSVHRAEPDYGRHIHAIVLE